MAVPIIVYSNQERDKEIESHAAMVVDTGTCDQVTTEMTLARWFHVV